MKENAARTIIEKYLNGQATPEELQIFREWLLQQPERKIKRILADYTDAFRQRFATSPVNEEWLSRMLERKEKLSRAATSEPDTLAIPQAGTGKKHRRFYYTTAAALVLVIAGILYRVPLRHASPQGTARSAAPANDALPASDKARLTLADGTVILLDSTHTGSLADQGGTSVEKVSQGKLAYHSGANNPAKVLINGVSTPRGGKYQVVLPDGTTVLLNAASLLKFPTAFTGNERRVELTGEAYFSVSKDAARPFIITANGVQVMVTGTELDLMAYPDEQETKTTLITGGVKVVQGNTARVLKPGQEATVNKSTNELRVIPIDTADAAAWTKGFFNFEAATVPVIMREISRWYDVTVLYEGTPSNEVLTGKAPRNITLFRLQQILALNNIHFTIEGKTIRVQS